MATKIEWADDRWNPIAGCSMVSPGCTNCYAMRMAFRLDQMGQAKYEGLTEKTPGGKIRWTGKLAFDEEVLLQPLKWKKPKRVFVGSMTDIFHEEVPFEWIDKIFAVMALTPHITYQVLTKRPDRMAEYFFNVLEEGDMARWSLAAMDLGLYFKWIDVQFEEFPLPNVWLGTSVENQEQANKRIPDLLKCPAKVRFLSCEPLLGPVDLTSIRISDVQAYNSLKGGRYWNGEKLVIENIGSIHWVIAGGESGPGARPMHPDWVRSLRDQCVGANVPFFFKQWGEWMPTNRPLTSSEIAVLPVLFDENDGKCLELEDGSSYVKVGKKAAGRKLDGVEWNQFPVTGGNEGGNG